MKLLSIGKFAKEVGVTITTLRRMHESGELIPHYVSKGGTRYYSTEQINEFSNAPKKEKIVIGYCRVSTPAQKDDLNTQVKNIKSYMYARGYKFEIVTDVGSGINYNEVTMSPTSIGGGYLIPSNKRRAISPASLKR